MGLPQEINMNMYFYHYYHIPFKLQHQQPKDDTEDLKLDLGYGRNLFDATENAMRKLFTIDEIKTCSLTGQAPNSKTAAKPKLNPEKVSAMFSALQKKYPAATQSNITSKVQSVMKKVSKETKKQD